MTRKKYGGAPPRYVLTPTSLPGPPTMNSPSGSSSHAFVLTNMWRYSVSPALVPRRLYSATMRCSHRRWRSKSQFWSSTSATQEARYTKNGDRSGATAGFSTGTSGIDELHEARGFRLDPDDRGGRAGIVPIGEQRLDDLEVVAEERGRHARGRVLQRLR